MSLAFLFVAIVCALLAGGTVGAWALFWLASSCITIIAANVALLVSED